MIRGLWTLVFLAILTSCSAPAPSPLQPGADQLVRISDAEIRGLDPQKVSDLASMRIAADQFEGLTRFDGKGEVQPGLASSWSSDKSGLIWTFALPDGLQFSDGTPISAELFPLLWQRLNDPAMASPHLALFGGISDIRAPDRNTVIVILNAPMPQLPALLAHPALAALPLHIGITDNADWTVQRPMVASGPYRLVEWRLNDHLTLVRNEKYHIARPKIGTVVWKPIDDKLAAMRLFLSGGADISSDYPQSRHDWLMKNRSDAVRTGDYLGSYYFAFNTRQSPFDDVRVRRALDMTINRQWLSSALLPLGNRPAWGVVPPALREDQGFVPKWSALTLKQRQLNAKKLLREAGFDRDNPLRFEIRINSSTEHRRMAVAMAAMWEPLGVEATILNSEANLHFAAMRRGEFALARSGWIADLPTPENFLSVHLSNAGAINYSGFAYQPFDAALEKALSESDPKRRLNAMRDTEQLLMEQVPVIPLYYYKTGALVASRVVGWHDNAGNIHPSAALSLRRP